MSAVVADDVERRLVEICDQLELEPVLRRLQANKALTREQCEGIRNYKTAESRANALVDAVCKDDGKAEAFVAALKSSGQTGLAELIVPPSEDVEASREAEALKEQNVKKSHGSRRRPPNESRRRPPNDEGEREDLLPDLHNVDRPPLDEDLRTCSEAQTGNTASSVRSRHLKEITWSCHAKLTTVCRERHIPLGWQRFEWCTKCRQYLCYLCRESDEHSAMGHKKSHWVENKLLHQAVDMKLQADHNESLGKLVGLIDAFRDRLVAAAVKEFQEKSLFVAFRKHLKVNKARRRQRAVAQSVHLSLVDAEMAACQAIAATTRQSLVPAPSCDRLAEVQQALEADEASSMMSLLQSATEKLPSALEKLKSVSSGSGESSPVGAIDTEATDAGSSEQLSGIWAVGGDGHERCVSLWNPDTGYKKCWDSLLLRPRKEGHRCLTWAPTECLVIGGYTLDSDENSTFTAHTEAVSLRSRPSTNASTLLPLTLASFAAASTADGAFVCGGTTQERKELAELGSKRSEKDDADKRYFEGKVNDQKECYMLPSSGQEWLTIAAMREARMYHAAAALGGCVWALGGLCLSSCEFYNPVVDKWYDFPNLPEDTHNAAATSLDKRIMLTGNADDNLKQTLLCDPREGRWTCACDMNKGRWGHGLVPWKGRVYALGGKGWASAGTAEVWEPRAGVWRMVAEGLENELPDGAAYYATD